MYRTKKYQYLLYKHVLLHGLNVAVALGPLWQLIASSSAAAHASGPNFLSAEASSSRAQAQLQKGSSLLAFPSAGSPLGGGDVAAAVDPSSAGWRAYWLCLNAAYVMEFFLQTLVKKGKLPQRVMLKANQLLMAGSSAAAAGVLGTALLGGPGSPGSLPSTPGGSGNGDGGDGDCRVVGGGAPFAVACLTSLFLNFSRRGKGEGLNVALAAAVGTAVAVILPVAAAAWK
jgi:hypothetical protein